MVEAAEAVKKCIPLAVLDELKESLALEDESDKFGESYAVGRWKKSV